MNLHSPITLDSDLRYRVVSHGDQYRWLDRKTNEFLKYEDGKRAIFNTIDEAITAFGNGVLGVEYNEHLNKLRTGE